MQTSGELKTSAQTHLQAAHGMHGLEMEEEEEVESLLEEVVGKVSKLKSPPSKKVRLNLEGKGAKPKILILRIG